MSSDNKRKLYDALSQDYDMGTYEQFCKDIQDETKRKKLYDATSEAYDYGDYAKFSSQLGFGTTAPAPSPPTLVEDVKPEKHAKQPKKQQTWQPTPMQKAFMSHAVQSQLDQYKASTDAMLERSQNTMDYYRGRGGITGAPVKGKMKVNPASGKVEQTYLTPTGTSTTNKAMAEHETRAYNEHVDMTVAGQLRRAGRDLQNLHRKRDARAKAIEEEWAADYKKNKAPLAAVLAAGTYRPSIEGDQEYRALTAAIHQAEKRVQTLQHENDRQQGKDVGFWRGFSEVVGDIKTWDFGYSGLLDAMTMLDASRPSPKALPKTEAQKAAQQTMLEQTAEAQAAQAAYGQNDSFWNRAGVMTGEMLPFMLDFALMGGSNSGTSGVTRTIDAALLKSLRSAAPKVARNKAAQWTVKALGSMPEDLLYRAPLMTNSVQGMKTASDIIDRKLGDVVVRQDGTYDFSNDKTWGSAIWQGEANAIIENYSEMFGTHLEGVLSLNTLSKIADTFGAKRLSGVLAKASSSELAGIAGTMQKHLNRLGVSDYFGEVGEEYYGQLWRTMLNLDDAYKHNPDGTRTNLFLDGQFHGDIWGGMALSMGLMGAGKYTISAAAYSSMKHRVNKTDARAAEIFTPDVWEGWRDKIDNTLNSDIGAMAESIVTDTSLTPEQRDAAMNYMEASLNLRGFNLSSIARQRGGGQTAEEAAANESYMDGYSSTTPQEMNDAKRMLDLQRQRLASSLSDDMVQEYDADPIGALSRTTDPELRRIAADYVNAKQVYDGMIQRVRDDLDGRIAQSDAMIDSRVNRETGMIQPATMKIDDRLVYIVNGSVSMYEDGTGVDTDNSSESIIIRDAETGRIEFADPAQVLNVGEGIDAEIEKEAARNQIIQEIAQAAANNIDGILSFSPGDTYSVLDIDGNPEDISILGQATDENGIPLDGYVDIQYPDGTIQSVATSDLQQWVDAANEKRVAQFAEERATERAAADEAERQADETGLSNPNRDRSLLPDNWEMPYYGFNTTASRYIESERGTGGILYQDEQGNDAIVISAIDNNNYVGYFREYDEQGQPTNRWSAKFQNGSGLRENYRDMMQTAQELLPAGHELTEHTSVSTDGLRNLANQLKHGYELQYDEQGNIITTEVMINMMARENDLGLADYEPGNIDPARVSSEEYKEAAARLIPYMEALGLSKFNIHWEDGYLYVDHPVLRRADTAQQETDPGVPESDEIVLNSGEIAENEGQGVPKVEEFGDGGIIITPDIAMSDEEVAAALAGEESAPSTASEETQPSALSQIPTDEKGDPIYEQAEPGTAWDALLEETEDEQIAQNVIAQEIAEREDALKKLEKQKPKAGLSTREKIQAEKDKKKAMDDIRKSIDHWKRMSSTKQRRQAEADAIRNEETRRRAEERRAQEEQARAEREEAERQEREALNGVPDWSHDTPQDARARGYRRFGPEKVDRQEPVTSVSGKEVEVKFGESELSKGKATLINVSSLQPSHIDGMRNPRHFIDEAQPKERTDAPSREAARKIASNIRPEEITSSVTAYIGAPTVNSRGETIQGNSRAAALRLMYETQPEQAAKYRQYLIDHAADFGLTPEQVEGMVNPVLVNMLDVADDEAIRLGQFVAQDTESGGIERIKPKNAVKKMGNKIRSFTNILLHSSDDEASLSQLVDSNGVHVLKWMAQQGFISDTQYASSFDSKGHLKGEAANDLKGILYQSIFTGGSTRLEEMFNNLPAKAQRAILATAFRDYDSSRADRMVEEIQQSIIAYNDMMYYDAFAQASNIKEATGAMESWKRQYAMDDVTGEPYIPAENFSNFALALAAIYKGGSQRFIQQIFNDLYDTVQGTAQDTLFEEADKTPKPLAEAIKKVLDLEYQPIKQEETNDNGSNGSDAVDLYTPQSETGGPGSDGNAENGERRQEATRTADSRAGTSTDSGSRNDVKPVGKGKFGAIFAAFRGQAKAAWQYLSALKSGQARGVFYRPEIGEIDLVWGEAPTPFSGKGLAHIDRKHVKTLGDFASMEEAIGVIDDVVRNGGFKEDKANTLAIEKDNYRVVIARNEAGNWVLTAFDKDTPAKEKKKRKDAATRGTAGQPNAEARAVASDLSEDKGNALLSDKQEKGVEISLGERISEAEAEVNTNPTEAQKETGNYKKGHVQVGAFDVTIENPKGSKRSGTDEDGKKWETTMTHTYGYIRGTQGVDGDHIDVYLSSDIDGWNGRKVFVVDRYNPDGTFDEHKVMLGFNDKADAIQAYLSNYEDGWEKGRRLVFSTVSIEDFEKWIESSHRKQKPFKEYKSVHIEESHEGGKDALHDEIKQWLGKKGLEPDESSRSAVMRHFKIGYNRAGKILNAIAEENAAAQQENTATINEFDPWNALDRVQFAKLPNKERMIDVGWDKANGFPSVLIAHPTEDGVAAEITFNGTKWKVSIVPVEEWENLSVRAHRIIDKGIQPAKQREYINKYIPKELQDYFESGQALKDNNKNPDRGAKEKVYKDWGIIFLNADTHYTNHDNAVSSDGYTIVSKPYTNKQGKTLDTHLVTFDRDFSKEEQKKIRSMAKEKKGWYDRETGGYMLRSREDAEEFAASVMSLTGTLTTDAPVSLSDIETAINISETEKPTGETPSTKVESKHKVGDRLAFGDQEVEVVNIHDNGNLDLRGSIAGIENNLININPDKVRVPGSDESVKYWYDIKLAQFKKLKIRPSQIPGMRKQVEGKVEQAKERIEAGDKSFVAVEQMAQALAMEQVLNDIEMGKVKLNSTQSTPSPSSSAQSTSSTATEQKPEAKPVKRPSKWVDEEDAKEFERLRDILRNGLGQLNVGFPPELLYAGAKMSYLMMKHGVRKFAEYATAMIEELGDAIRPHLKALYNFTRSTDEVTSSEWAGELTPFDEVMSFDTANFDKAEVDAMATAENVVAEEQSQQHIEDTVSTIKDTIRQNPDGTTTQTITEGGTEIEVTEGYFIPGVYPPVKDTQKPGKKKPSKSKPTERKPTTGQLDLFGEEDEQIINDVIEDTTPPEPKPEAELSGDSADYQERSRQERDLVDDIVIEIMKRTDMKVGGVDKGSLTMRDVRGMLENYPLLADISATDLQELVERAMTILTRTAAKAWQADPRKGYERVVAYYNMQPSLNARDSERLIKQQYSTPTPFGYVMGQFVNAKNDVKSVLEPSAGNGALTIMFDPTIVHVNDIDQRRLENLRTLGYDTVTAQNGLLPFEGEKVDGVLTNPPFGSVTEKIYDGIFRISSLEGQMAINALDSMKDGGRAAIIIGGNTSYRTNGSMNPKDAAFFGYLYSHYNVVDVININGKALYARNGTGYDVRMILIDGRKTGEFTRVFPPVKSKARAEQVTTFDELYKRVQDDILHIQQRATEPSDVQQPIKSDTDRGTSGDVRQGGNKPNAGAGQRPGETSDASGSASQQSVGGQPTRENDEGRTRGVDNGNGRDAGSRQPTPGEKPHTQDGRRGSRNDGRTATSSRPDNRGERLAVKPDLTTEKVPYPNQSDNGFTLLSVVPAAQAEVLQRSLGEIGDVDQFLVEELGYSSKKELYTRLAAEQIDSVALAINQMNKGNAFIIGDMTGVGKGRQGAALIRYGVATGNTPIYFTQKPHLFTDNYRDLADIGSENLRPFIISSDAEKATIKDANGKVVHKLPSKKEQSRVFDFMLEHGKLPEEYDYVLVTYSQIQNGTEDYEVDEDGNWTHIKRKLPKKSKGYTATDVNGQKRRDALEALAANGLTILDESHTVGGDSGCGRYMQMLTGLSRGTTFLSATFAKRADNMPIYAQRTAIAEAGVKANELIEAIAKGGVTLQEIMSKQLVESGQMIRRERSFEGVSIDWLSVEEATDRKQRQQFNEVANIFNSIRNFQNDFIKPIIDGMNDAAAEQGATVGQTQGTKDLGVRNTPFASKMYNLVNQLLFALKVDAVADRVIENLRNGYKPVISFTNTMEGFLASAPKGMVMDEVPNFSLTLMRALDGVMRFTENDADQNSEGGQITFSQLSPEGQATYNAVKEKIMNLSADLPISPMDAIRMKIEEAGYSVAEITGRETQLDRTEDGKYIVRNRTNKDSGKNMRDFNSGKLDVLMINKSGSTGISLHASSKFEDQRQRVMVFAQFQSDINDEVQMRGRIDRSGQVVRGRYEYIMSTIPAEQRIQMMFKAKLKSLDANTTSSQKSKFNEMEIVDYLNKYGDEVVWEYMKEHPELSDRLGDPLNMLQDKSGDGSIRTSETEDTSKKADCAGKISRYLAFLSVEEQDEIFKEITEAYKVKIQLLDDAGENDLEITTMPLRAEAKSKQIWHKGENPGSGNAFADNTYVEEVEVDVLKKPMKRGEIEDMTRKLMGDKLSTATEYDQQRYGMKEGELNWGRYADKMVDEVNNFFNAKADDAIEKMKEAGAKRVDKAREKAVKNAIKARANGENTFSDQEIEALADVVAKEAQDNEDAKQYRRREEINAVRDRIKHLLSRLRAGHIYVVPQDLKQASAEMFTQSFGTFVGFKFNKSYTLGSSTAIFATLDGRRKVELALNDKAIETIIRCTDTALRYSPKEINSISMDNWDSKVPTQTRQTRHIITGNLLQALVDTEKGEKTKGNLISFSTLDGETRQGILMSENFKLTDLRNSVPLRSRLKQIQDGHTVVSENGDVQIQRIEFDWKHRGEYELRVPKSKQRGGIYTMHPELLKLVDGHNFITKGNNMVGYVLPENLAEVVDILSRAPFNLTVLEESKLTEDSAVYRDGSGSYSDSELSYENDPWSKAFGESLRTKKKQEQFAERMRRDMAARANKLANTLGVEIEIIEDASGLEGRKRKAKGWYDTATGKITIVLGNHKNVEDIEATMLHEVVAHHGLRELFGEKFDAFLDAVYENAENSIKEQIDLLATKNGWNRRVATEEYLAGLAERTDFENTMASWWSKIKNLFMNFLRGCGFKGNVTISDNELRYVLWMSWKNLQHPGAFKSFLGVAEKVAKEYELGVGAYAETDGNASDAAEPGERFRDGDFTPHDRKMVANIYENMVAQGSYQFREATQDSMLGLKKLYEAILTEGDKSKRKDFRIEEVAGYENAYLYENRMSSTNNGEQHQYFTAYMKPLLESVHNLCGSKEIDRRILTDYMMAKHGLERNEYMRNEAAAAGEETERDFAGLCGLTGKDDWQAAETEAQKIVDDYENDHDTTELWDNVKRATTATLDKIYLTGLISEDTYNKVLGMYDYYIPLRGWEETTSDEVYGYLTSKDGPLMGNVFKTAEGRESKADDPIATIAMMADDAIRQGNRNVMKQRFLNFVHGNPSDLVSVNELWLQYNDAKDEWQPVFADLEPDMTNAEVESEIAKFEAKMEALAAAEPDKYKRSRDARNIPYKVVRWNLDEHQVLVKRNGHTYVMTINGNPRAAQALNGLTNPDTDMGGLYGKILKGASFVNRHLSAFYTTRNPDFVMSNFLRDMLYSNAMTWVKENPRYALRFHRNFGKINPVRLRSLLAKWESNNLSDGIYIEKMFKEFMLNGGETGYTSVKDIEGHKRTISKEIKKIGHRDIGSKSWYWLGKQLDLLNRSVENCARFAAFLTSREMGRPLDRSIFDAKEISVNFNKKGAGDRFLDSKGQKFIGKAGSYLGGAGRSLYVFWNAGVQGMTNFGRAGLRNPKKALSGAAALFALGSVIPLLAQLLGGGDGDDDDKNAYYNLPEYVRRSNICFKAGDQWITIPLPIEYKAIYGMGELSTGVISGNERYSNAELARQIAAQVSQTMPLDMLEGGGGISPFIPSAVKPFTEAYIMNKGWTGLPVYKDTPFNKNDPEWTKAYQSADQHLVGFAKWLNETSGGDDFKKGAIDINPAKLEYLLNGTFGGMMTFPMKVKKTGEAAFGDREFEWRNMPLVNRVVKSGDERTANRKLQNEYFKYKKEAEETDRLRKKYENAADEGILAYAEKIDFLYNSDEYLRYEIYKKFESEINAIHEEIKAETDPETKKDLQAELFVAMRELVDELHEVGK